MKKVSFEMSMVKSRGRGGKQASGSGRMSAGGITRSSAQSPAEDLSTGTPTPPDKNNKETERPGSRRRSLRNLNTGGGDEVGSTTTSTVHQSSASRRGRGGKQPAKLHRAKSLPKTEPNANAGMLPNPVATTPSTSTSSQSVFVRNSGGGSCGDVPPQIIVHHTPQQQSQSQTGPGFQQQLHSQSSYAPVPRVSINNANNPLVWAGMKDIRDNDCDDIITLNWDNPMVLVAWSPNRKMTANPENDAFIRSFNELPWREQGNVVFFCAGGKVVRCHAIILHGIIPHFTKQLMQMHNYHFSPFVKELPYIPVFVMGVEEQVILHLLNMLHRGVDYLTGRELAQLKKVMDVLDINNDLAICIAQNDFNVETYINNGRTIAPTTTMAPPTPHGQANPVMPMPMFVGPQPQQMVASSQSQRFNYPLAQPTGMEQAQPMPTHRVSQSAITATMKKCYLTLPTKAKAKGRPPAPTTMDSGSDGTETLAARIKQRRETQGIYSQAQQIGETKPSLVIPNTTLITRPTYEVGVGGPRRPFCPFLVEKVAAAVVPGGSGGVHGGAAPLPNPAAAEKDDGDDSSANQSQATVVMSNESLIKSEMKSPIPVSTIRPVPVDRRSSSTTSAGKRKRKTVSVSDDEEFEETVEVDNNRKRTRTVYEKHVKVDALEALHTGKGIRDVADSMGLPPKLISRWKYEAKKADDAYAKNSPAHDEDQQEQNTLSDSADNEQSQESKMACMTASVDSMTMTENENESAPEAPITTTEIKPEPVPTIVSTGATHPSLPTSIEGLIFGLPEGTAVNFTKVKDEPQDQGTMGYFDNAGTVVGIQHFLNPQQHYELLQQLHRQQQQLKSEVDNNNGGLYAVQTHSQTMEGSSEGNQPQEHEQHHHHHHQEEIGHEHDVGGAGPESSSPITFNLDVPYPFSVPTTAESEPEKDMDGDTSLNTPPK